GDRRVVEEGGGGGGQRRGGGGPLDHLRERRGAGREVAAAVVGRRHRVRAAGQQRHGQRHLPAAVERLGGRRPVHREGDRAGRGAGARGHRLDRRGEGARLADAGRVPRRHGHRRGRGRLADDLAQRRRRVAAGELGGAVVRRGDGVRAHVQGRDERGRVAHQRDGHVGGGRAVVHRE